MTKKPTGHGDYSDNSNKDNDNAIKDKTSGDAGRTPKRTVVLSKDVNDYDTGEDLHNSNDCNNDNYSIFRVIESKTSKKNKNFKLGNKANPKNNLGYR
jgi:hypothetical protein